MAKLFDKPIDGNKVITENRRRNSLTGQYGMIRNNSTGEMAEVSRDTKPQPMQPMTHQPQQREERDTSYDAYMMETDEGYRGYHQQISREEGRSPSYGEYEATKQMPMETLNPEELEETIQDYSVTISGLIGVMEEEGMSMDELAGHFPEETTDETIAMVLDPTKMKNFDDMINVGILIDQTVDILNLDARKFFSTGEIVKCDKDCQEENNRRTEERRQEDLYNG